MQKLKTENSEKKITLRVSFVYGLYKQSVFFFIIIIAVFLSQRMIQNNFFENSQLETIITNCLYFTSLFLILRIIYGLVYFKLLKYELYKDHIVTKEGVFVNRLNFLELYRVKDYSVYQSFFMKIFNIMNIQLITSDRTSPILNLKGIPKSNIFNQIRENVEEQRKIKGVREFD